MGQVAFDNFCAGIARDLLKVEQISGRHEQDIYLIRHPFEELLVEQLQNSSETITIGEQTVNSVKLPAIYQQASKLGYLAEEIEELINILKVRGMADRKTEAGTQFLYLVETFINFAELEVKLKGLEENVALAKSNGFEYQCDHLSSAQTLAVTLGIENHEVRKDELRQNLNSAEEHLKHKCAEWVKTGHSHLKQQIHELETLHLQVPTVLDQQTGHPVTEFSQILFQSIQPEVKSVYTKISDEIRNIQGKVRETCDREIGTYESNRTPQNAIETATRLRQTRSRVDTDINRLNQKGTDAQELNRLFEHWRVLAQQVVGDRHLMVNSQEDSDVQNLVTRLDETQRRIRQHLADNRLSLKEVLSNHEHFKTQINEIKTEFDQFLGGKEKEFLVYLASLEEQLIKVVDTPHVGVKWNPADSDGCYRETREKAVEKLKAVIKTALEEIDSLTRNLLKPIEIFAVPDSLRDRAIQLRQDVRKYADEFQAIRPKFITEDVDQQLQNWVSELLSLRQRGEDIFKRWQAIERDLTEFGSKLSPKVQKLRETLTPLLDDGTFSSPREILECLEELYQANLVNLTVHRK
jgi:RNase H-fold protein (predicted Holliday junction resolvase)